MEIRKTASSISRLVLEFLVRVGARKYAIEVDAEHVGGFEITETKICDSWENADGSVVFILQSRKDLRCEVEAREGVRGVSLM